MITRWCTGFSRQALQNIALRFRSYGDFPTFNLNRYHTDCHTGRLKAVHQRHEFATVQLGLDFKPSRVQRTAGGVSFLGCRVWPTHVELNARSKRRWRRRVKVLERAERLGLISESDLQQRLAALTAFAKTAGARSWRFRQSVLQPSVVNDP